MKLSKRQIRRIISESMTHEFLHLKGEPNPNQQKDEYRKMKDHLRQYERIANPRRSGAEMYMDGVFVKLAAGMLTDIEIYDGTSKNRLGQKKVMFQAFSNVDRSTIVLHTADQVREFLNDPKLIAATKKQKRDDEERNRERSRGRDVSRRRVRMQEITKRQLKRIIKEEKSLLLEHLHDHPVRHRALMAEELPNLSSLSRAEREDIEFEFRELKKMLNGNIVKMMDLSIDNPKMYMAKVRDNVDYLEYDQMNAKEKYEYLRTENMYGYEQLEALFDDIYKMLNKEN